MAVRTVLPRQVMSRGRPTLTESNRAITSSRATIPQFDRVSAEKSGAGLVQVRCKSGASLGVEWMIAHLPIRALSSGPVDKFAAQADIGDTTPNPVHRELERRFCRTDRRVLYDLAATPPS